MGKPLFPVAREKAAAAEAGSTGPGPLDCVWALERGDRTLEGLPPSPPSIDGLPLLLDITGHWDYRKRRCDTIRRMRYYTKGKGTIQDMI